MIGTELASSFVLKKTNKDKRYLGLSSIPGDKQELEPYKELLVATQRAIARIREPDSKQKKERRNAKEALKIIEAFEDAYYEDEEFDSSEYNSGSQSGPENDGYLPHNTAQKHIRDSEYDLLSYDDSVYASSSEDRYDGQITRRVAHNNSGSRYISSAPLRERRGSSFR